MFVSVRTECPISRWSARPGNQLPGHQTIRTRRRFFVFGRVLNAVRGLGLTLLMPSADRLDGRSSPMPVPAQDGITRDNVTVRVDAVVYYRVIDPLRAAVDVQDYGFADRPGRADVAALDHRQERPR